MKNLKIYVAALKEATRQLEELADDLTDYPYKEKALIKEIIEISNLHVES